MGANVSTMRPARDLLHQLPMLPTRPDLSVDYEAADAALLLALAENSETVMNTFQHGLSALGVILAHASPEVAARLAATPSKPWAGSWPKPQILRRPCWC